MINKLIILKGLLLEAQEVDNRDLYNALLYKILDIIPEESKNHTSGWTQEQLNQLESLYQDGLKHKDIAKHLGKSLSSTSAKLSLLGLSNRRG